MHIWVRGEERDNERRVGVTPQGVQTLIQHGFRVTVEDEPTRAIGIDGYKTAGAEISAPGTWRTAPKDTIIFGLKELPDDGAALKHKHIMFGHAYKGQSAGQRLLKQFNEGGGRLLDIEYLTDTSGRRVAAFGYWAGFAGAAVALHCWAAQAKGQTASPVEQFDSADDMLTDLRAKLSDIAARPTSLVIGALGRVGTGVTDLCTQMGVTSTKWDLAETAHGGPFPEVLAHDILFNCILARPGTPVFVPLSAKNATRKLCVIGDIACDPESDFSPIKVYNQTTTWQKPALRVHDAPALDVTAIDNLPSMLPMESSQDFANQLLPTLLQLKSDVDGVWARADAMFAEHLLNVS